MESESPHQAIRCVDTVTRLDLKDARSVVIAGSHGGEYAAFCAARAQVKAAIFNDAGVGKDAEGIHALEYFDALGVPAATTSHLSARIGDGKDATENGVISYANRAAGKLGCRPSLSTYHCAELMLLAPSSSYDVPPKAESRTVIPGADGRAPVVVIDSLSLLLPEDKLSIFVTGSHGAVLPVDNRLLLYGDALGGLFCDAGFGKEGIGVSRLLRLDALGKPAAAVSVTSARIGNGMSMLETGIISFVNDAAFRCGIRVGMASRAGVSILQASLSAG